MTELKFACPQCKQHLEADETMRGQVIACPSCNARISIPGVPSPNEAATPKGAPPPMARKNWAGMVVVLVVGLVIGYAAGSARNQVDAAKSPDGPNQAEAATPTKRVGFRLPSFGQMNKEAWMAKVTEQKFYDTYYRQFVDVDKDAFVQAMGKPSKTQAVGEKVYWYYACSDGHIQLVIDKDTLETEGKISTIDVNEF